MSSAANSLDILTAPSRRPFDTVGCLLLCAAIMFLDGYDIVAMALAVPHVSAAYGFRPADFSGALTAVLVGIGVGGTFLAQLGDRYGRRPVIIAFAALIAVATIGTATASHLWQFTAWRFATGLVLGVCLPNVIALVSEIATPARRAFTLGLVTLGVSIGAMTSGLIVPRLVALHGWPTIFIAPGCLAAVITALLALYLPESPAFGAVTATAEGADRTRLRDLLKPPLLMPMAIFSGLYAANAFAVYLLTSWIPTLLPMAGFSVTTGAHYIGLLQFGGLAIGLLLSRLLDSGHAVAALAGIYIAAAVALILFSLIPPGTIRWGFLIMIAGGGFTGAQMAVMAVATSFFPPRYLSSALGVGVAAARIGAIGGPLLGGHLIAAKFSVPQFFLFATIPALICAAICFAIPRARRTGQAVLQYGEPLAPDPNVR